MNLIQPWRNFSLDERWRRERQIDVAFNIALAALAVVLFLVVALLFTSAGVFGALADSI